MNESVRQTSIDALHELQASGKGQTQRAVVLQAVFNSIAGVTRSQIAVKTGLTINATCGRVNELLKAGVLVEDGKRVCPVTGKTVMVVKATRQTKQGELL